MTETAKDSMPRALKVFVVIAAFATVMMISCMAVDTLIRNGWLPKGPWAERNK